jgi:hypothetical protein
MQHYRLVRSLVNALIASICTFFAMHGDIFSKVSEACFQSGVYDKYFALATLPVLTFLFQNSDFLVAIVLERIPVVSYRLRRLFAGTDFIEGDWPLVVVDAETLELKYYGYMSIAYESGQLRVFGADWNPDLSHAHDFTSKQSRYADGRVQYWYEQGENGTMRGYTEIFFFPRKTLAQRLSGEFLDCNHQHRFYARRINEAPIEPSEQTRIAAAKKVWESVQPNLKSIVGRAISVDWE